MAHVYRWEEAGHAITVVWGGVGRSEVTVFCGESPATRFGPCCRAVRTFYSTREPLVCNCGKTLDIGAGLALAKVAEDGGA